MAWTRRERTAALGLALVLGAAGGGCASMVASMTGQTVEEVERRQRFQEGEWIRTGGEVDPLGRTETVSFLLRGVAVEAIRSPYGDAYGTLMIRCNEMPPGIAVAIQNGPLLGDGDGEARIDGWPGVHRIGWVGMRGGFLIAGLAGKLNTDPEFPDLREALLAGRSLTVAAPTNVGTVYFEFDLDGLESQESQCPPATLDTAAASGDVPPPDTTAPTNANVPPTDTVVPAVESLPRPAVTSRPSVWLKTGGGTDPLGRLEPIQFARLGRAVERIRSPYSDARATITIICKDSPPTIAFAAYDGPPLLRDVDGEARIDDGQVHPIDLVGLTGRWVTFLAGGVTLIDPEFPDLREELRAGDSLTVAASTIVGRVYFRFALDGLEVQENLCPPPSKEG